MSYKLMRSIRGDLEAESTIDLGFDRRALRVSTSKVSSGAIVTSAQCIQYDADRPGAFSFVFFQDYRATLTQQKARATAQTIARQHLAALANIAPTLAACRAHYGQQTERTTTGDA
jgi:hypothetical protein